MVNGFQRKRWNDAADDGLSGNGELRQAPFPGEGPELTPIAGEWEEGRIGRFIGRGSSAFQAAQAELSPFVLDRLSGEGAPPPKRFDDALEPQGELETDEALFQWALMPAGGAIIVSCSCKGTRVVIPAQVEGVDVTAVGSHSFSLCYELEEVELPPALAEIGEYAFMNTAISSIATPCTLRGIGTKAFYRCSKLQHVRLNEGLEYIGTSAFENAPLASVALPGSLATLGPKAFKGMSICFDGPNQNFSIGRGATPYELIGGGLYYRAGDDLMLVEFLDADATEYAGPKGLRSVGRNAFLGHRRLARAVLPEGLEHVGACAFKGCSRLTVVELPSTVRHIDKEAFIDTSLASLRLPAGLESLGLAALCTVNAMSREAAPTLRRIEVEPGNKRFYLDGGVLYERGGGPDGDKAILYVGPDRHVAIPDHVTAIGPYAFANISGIVDLELHDGIASIDAGGFFLAGRPPVVHVRSGEAPGGVYRIYYPNSASGLSALRSSLSSGRVDVAEMYLTTDRLALNIFDPVERAHTLIRRLADPVCLKPSIATIFRDRLERSVVDSCRGFAKTGYLEGITALETLGILRADNVDECIAALSEDHEAAAVNVLLDIRRRVFNLPTFDFDL